VLDGVLCRGQRRVLVECFFDCRHLQETRGRVVGGKEKRVVVDEGCLKKQTWRPQAHVFFCCC
jgi:hypothetical protein